MMYRLLTKRIKAPLSSAAHIVYKWMSDIEDRCIECGVEVSTLSDTPLCSKSCQREYAHRMIRNMSDTDAWCPTCHDEFDSVNSVCYHHNHKHSFELHRTEICEECGGVFRPSSTSNDNKYCSEECFGKNERIELVASICENCGSAFEHYPSYDRAFCSTSCSTSGEYHWNWQGGSSQIRKTVEYRQWRQAIHNKYESCNKCGATENLHAHHIVPVSQNENLATDVENGVLLCGACHSEEHQNMPSKLFENGVFQ